MLLTALFLICLLNGQEVNANCAESRQLETTCSHYCFQVVSPLLEHTKAMRHQIANCADSPSLSTEMRLQAIEGQMREQQEMLKELLKLQRILVASRNMKFESIGSKTYYISKERRLSWSEAEQKCRELGGHMISVHSQEEANAVSERVKPHNFWVDIWDPKNVGDYISVTTGRKPDFVPWIPGEPNRWNNVESCVQLKSYADTYLMNDFECNVKQPFVCEFPDV